MFDQRLQKLWRDVRAAVALVATGCQLLITSVVSGGRSDGVGPSETETIVARLFDAVATRDTDGLRHMLDAGADPNQRHPTGPSLLEAAIKHRAVDIVQLLLARGAAANATRPGQNAALALAAFRNQKPSATLLIEAGADPALPNPGPLGGTPLELAVEGGYEELCRSMLDHAAVDAYTLGKLVDAAPARGSDSLVDMLRAARTQASSREPAA